MTPTTTKLIEEKVLQEFEQMFLETPFDTPDYRVLHKEKAKSFLRSSLLAVAEKAHKEGFKEAVEKVRERMPKEKELPSRIDLEIDAVGASNAIRNQGFNMCLSDLLASLETLEKETL